MAMTPDRPNRPEHPEAPPRLGRKQLADECQPGEGGEWAAFADWFCDYWIRRGRRGMDEWR
jgi:hypothetical protein